jgi:hypothetical protein
MHASIPYLSDINVCVWCVQGTAGAIRFSTAESITWWKALRIYDDYGERVCSLELENDAHGPLWCNATSIDSLMTGYRVELWKAKTLGVHEKVDEWSSGYLGPLLGGWVDVVWETDA